MIDFTLRHWLFLMLIFMIVGWMFESLLESFSNKRLINRGFLTGPYIPIYGFGGMLIIILCRPIANTVFGTESFSAPYGFLLIFFLGAIGCTSLEYFSGFLAEKLLKRRLWNYKKLFKRFLGRVNAGPGIEKFSIMLIYKNRIALPVSMLFGIASVVLVYIFPIIKPLVLMIDSMLLLHINLAVGTVIGIDFTHKVIASRTEIDSKTEAVFKENIMD